MSSTVGIDFSTITINRYQFITKDKRKTYTLDDDLPLETVLQVMVVKERYSRLQTTAVSHPDMTSDEAQPLVDEWSESVIDTALAIFRHTAEYAALSREELLAAFDVISLFAIVGFFSSRLGERSVTPPNATAMVAAPPNRKSRRASVSAHKPR